MDIGEHFGFLERGGIYRQEDLADIQLHMEFGRASKALSYTISNQAEGFREGRALTADNLFPHTPLKSSLTALFNPILGFLHRFGNWASIFIGAYIIFRVFMTFLQFVFRCSDMVQSLGCGCRAMMGALFPTAHLIRADRKTPPTRSTLRPL